MTHESPLPNEITPMDGHSPTAGAAAAWSHGESWRILAFDVQILRTVQSSFEGFTMFHGFSKVNF